MIKRLIGAVSANGVIGKKNALPFDYKEDLKWFKEKTLNSIVIMGRKTFEGIGKPLKNRTNVIISSSKDNIDGAIIFPSIRDAIMTYDNNANYNKNGIWFIGGAQIYREAMNYIDEIYLTLTPDIIEGDNIVYFPWISPELFSLKEIFKMPCDECESNLKIAHYIRN